MWPASIPPIFFNHVGQLNDIFPFFVLLARLESMFIFPTKCSFTAFTVDVSNSMEASQENPLFSRSTTHINNRIEEIGPALASLEWLWNQLIMIG